MIKIVKKTIRKSLALVMTLLFLGTIFVPAVSGNTDNSESALSNKASSNIPGEPSRAGSQQSRTGSTSFTYGPLGNRISSTDANGDTTYYLYEGTNVIQDRQSDGALAREYVSGVGGKLAMIDHTDDGNKPAGEEEVLYYLHDILGSVVVLTNANGNDCEQYYYDPYGKTVITDLTGTIERDESLFGNTFMWTGQRYDPENELYHFPARTYSTTLGRWLQRDPAGYVDGLNLYEYGRSNPLRYVDPLGLYNFDGLQWNAVRRGYREDHSFEETNKFMEWYIKEEAKISLEMFTMFQEPFATIRDISEAISGRDIFSGEKLPSWSRGVTALAIIPFVPGKALRSGQRILTKIEVAKELAVSRRTVYQMIKKGVLPKKITEDALLEFMIKHKLPFFSEMGKLDNLRSAARYIGVGGEETRTWLLHGHLKGHYFPGGGRMIHRISHDEVVRFKQKYGRAIARRGDPNYVNAEQACGLLGVGRATVAVWITQGQFKGYGILRLPGGRVGGHWIISRTQLYDFAAKYHFPRDGMRDAGGHLNRLGNAHKYPRTKPLYILDTNVFTRPG